MSDFSLAIPTILRHEGGFSDDKTDPGGATNFGISLRFLIKSGDLDGDGLLDGDIDGDHDIDVDDIRKMTRKEAENIYFLYFWQKYDYSRINSLLLATKIFDLSVNAGPAQAHKISQRAIWSANSYKCIEDDSLLGPKTISFLNKTNPDLILAALKSEAAGFYRGLIQKNPDLNKYLNGWLKRAYE